MRADYRTNCGACGHLIEIGDEIEYEVDTGWVHVTCPDPLALQPGEQPCPRCFTVHRGECV